MCKQSSCCTVTNSIEASDAASAPSCFFFFIQTDKSLLVPASQTRDLKGSFKRVPEGPGQSEARFNFNAVYLLEFTKVTK